MNKQQIKLGKIPENCVARVTDTYDVIVVCVYFQLFVGWNILFDDI